MRPAPSLSRLLGLALAAVLAIAGLVAASAPAAQAADPLVGAPAVGACHDVGIKQAMKQSLTASPVPCSADHTLLTTAVVPVTADGKLTDAKIVDEAFASCRRHTEQRVGANPLRRALTLYSTSFFLPTAAQQEAGARWVSCHVAVWDTKGLNDLPQTLPRATRKPAASVARCAIRSSTVTCAERHTHRATVAVFVRAQGKDRAVQKKMETQGPRICIPKVGRAGGYSYKRHTPTKVVLTCFKKTRK